MGKWRCASPGSWEFVAAGVRLRGRIMQVKQVDYMWQIHVNGNHVSGVESTFAAAMNQVEWHFHQNAPVKIWKTQDFSPEP